MPAAPARPHFVKTDWLADNLGTPGLAIVDGSFYLPAHGRDAKAEYLAAHIPGAVRFDVEAICDPGSDLPHMMPDPVAFASHMRRLGIGDGMRIVVYDGLGLFSAPRVWWMLRAFGLSDVAILEGGMSAWRAEDRPLEDGETIRQPRHFTARLDHAVVASVDDVRRALATGGAQVIDVRAADRFRGEAPEPRPGLRAGHMPGSINLPWTELVSEGRMRPVPDLLAAFDKAGIDPQRPVITSCGSGVTAAILTLALDVAGRKPGALYDGSWAEWGSRNDLPIATG
jgi:thiosulfate/3-mercaptopyruvate sulfurtransferase